jgi:hypothetical protein
MLFGSNSQIVRGGLWIRFLLLRMLINRDLLAVNLDLPRLYEQAVRPTRIWVILESCIWCYEQLAIVAHLSSLSRLPLSDCKKALQKAPPVHVHPRPAGRPSGCKERQMQPWQKAGKMEAKARGMRAFIWNCL